DMSQMPRRSGKAAREALNWSLKAPRFSDGGKMPMNSYSARKRRLVDDKTDTHVTSTVTVHAPDERTEITEITIRVRPASPPYATNFNEFDVSQLRAEASEAPRVESLVKDFVDQGGSRRRI